MPSRNFKISRKPESRYVKGGLKFIPIRIFYIGSMQNDWWSDVIFSLRWVVTDDELRQLKSFAADMLLHYKFTTPEDDDEWKFAMDLSPLARHFEREFPFLTRPELPWLWARWAIIKFLTRAAREKWEVTHPLRFRKKDQYAMPGRELEEILAGGRK